MARDLKIQVLLKAIDKVTKPFETVQGAAGKLTQSIRDSKDQIKQLNDTQRKINGFRKLGTALDTTASKLEAAEDRARQLREQMEKTGGGSITLQKRYESAAGTVKRLTDKLNDQREELGKTGTALKDAGIDTGKLTDHEETLREKVDAANKAIDAQKDKLKKLGEQQARIDSFKGAAAKVGTAAGRVGTQGKKLAGQAAIAGAAGGYLFKTQFLDRAAEFEKFNTILKTVTGSEKKAAEAMSWVSDFAARTPFELAEVLESFTKLKAYGIDPVQDGLLKTLGDTASAMGKPVIQAVEAISDAITGENERLKEFGIKGSKSGGQITYEYTNAAGDTLTKSVDASNRKLIQSTLQAIWNEKYAGAMDEQSRTWNGMVSNLSDQWARFTNMVMGAGLFDRMRERLAALLDTIDKMAANGELAAWAEKVGGSMLRFFDGAWQVMTAISELTSKVAEAVGGWKNFAYLMVAIKLAPLALSIVSLGIALGGAAIKLFAVIKGSAMFAAAVPIVTGAIKAIGAALWALAANPIVLIIAGIAAAFAATAYIIYKNWEPITAFFSQTWGEIHAQVSAAIGKVTKVLLDWNPIGLIYRGITEGLSLLGVEIPDKFKSLGSSIIDGLIGGMLDKFPDIGKTMSSIANTAEEKFKSVLGINSPSRVFAEMGDDTMAGLKQGLERSEQGPVGAMIKASKSLIGAGAIAAGVGFAAPAVAGPINGSAAHSTASEQPYYHFEIHVHAQPGADSGEIGRIVRQQMVQAAQQIESRNRASLYDQD